MEKMEDCELGPKAKESAERQSKSGELWTCATIVMLCDCTILLETRPWGGSLSLLYIYAYNLINYYII